MLSTHTVIGGYLTDTRAYLALSLGGTPSQATPGQPSIDITEFPYETCTKKYILVNKKLEVRIP